jgi:tRNA modification GTPase
MPPRDEDTIAAIATPLGSGGIGIVRLSGRAAVAIADRFFRASGGIPLSGAPSHKLIHGWVEQDGAPLDEVLAVAMRAPHSYTCEDVVEVHCHGGSLAVRTVLELACAGGARLAQPGEFTQRAFLNGRMDLTQAEAVGDIVRSRSLLGLRVSADQLRGRLHGDILALREEVAQVAALVAAGIDFPEEDVVFAHRQDIVARLAGVRERLRALLGTATGGRMLREGVAVAIVGKPNVGKSSLLNALLRENRAIVTEVPGTTRDTLEEALELGGVGVRLIDTAGLRQTDDVVEREGISRAERAMALADLTLAVMDGSQPLDEDDRRVLEQSAGRPSLLVVNKRDRMPGPEPAWAPQAGDRPRVAVSARTGEGLEALEAWVRRWALNDERPVLEHAWITNLRQQQAAGHALGAVDAALAGLDSGAGEELLAVDLSRALDALGDIVGETTADDLLNRVFAEFCIGK